MDTARMPPTSIEHSSRQASPLVSGDLLLAASWVPGECCPPGFAHVVSERVSQVRIRATVRDSGSVYGEK